MQEPDISCVLIQFLETSTICQDFVDDEEHGAGRAILLNLQNSNIENKAVFVVRICSKTKLEENRIDCYLDAVENLFKEYPYNAVLKKKQELQPRIYGVRVTQTKKDNDTEKENIHCRE